MDFGPVMVSIAGAPPSAPESPRRRSAMPDWKSNISTNDDAPNSRAAPGVTSKCPGHDPGGQRRVTANRSPATSRRAHSSHDVVTATRGCPAETAAAAGPEATGWDAVAASTIAATTATAANTQIRRKGVANMAEASNASRARQGRVDSHDSAVSVSAEAGV